MSHAALSNLNFTPLQRRVIAATWGTYALYYLGRLNLSLALPTMAETLEVSRAQVGFLGTVFLWTYALGQIVNGELGNHFSPRWMVLYGLGGIAVLNLLFALQNSLLIMAILWAINGLAQSTGWGPMVRILSEHLSNDQRRRLSTFFSMSFSLGGALSWLVAGAAVAWGGWRAAFWVPGLLLLGVLILWYLADVDAHPASVETKKSFHWHDIKHEFSFLMPVLLVTAMIGFVDVGAVLWVPTYLKDTDLFPDSLLGAVSSLLPLFGIVGMSFAGYLLEKYGQVFMTIMALVLTATISLTVSILIGLPLQVAFLLLTMMLSSGVVALTISSMPIMIASQGRVSSVSGWIVAVFSLSGGFAGVVVGVVEEHYNWNTVFMMWVVCWLIAVGLTWWAAKRILPAQ